MRDLDRRPLTVSVSECAAVLGLSTAQVRRRLEDGRIPALRFGQGPWLISRRRFEAWLEEREDIGLRVAAGR